MGLTLYEIFMAEENFLGYSIQFIPFYKVTRL